MKVGLELVPMGPELYKAILAGIRGPNWAGDYPSSSDRAVASLGLTLDDNQIPWCQYQLVLGVSGLVVGHAGFNGAPINQTVEIAYGIVPSARGRGIAKEAVNRLIDIAESDPGVAEVVALVEPNNMASRKVLESRGFTLVSSADRSLTYSRYL
jgi:RimJ/RimL family protein N-acetyltransferase